MTKLAQEVVEASPGLDIEKWDFLASSLNVLLYQERIYHTPYFFFDGGDAAFMFRMDILMPYLNGKLDSDTNSDQIKSSKLYLSSINNTFESYLKEDLPELGPESKLPKEANKSRFFNRGYLQMFIALCFCQSQALYYLVDAIKQKSCLPFALPVYYQVLPLIGWPGLRRYTYPWMNIKQQIKFLSLITKFSPGKDLDEWGEIARFMNQLLADEGNLKQSSVDFFDGKHCLSFYKKYFEPFSVGKISSEYASVKEIVQKTQPYVG